MAVGFSYKVAVASPTKWPWINDSIHRVLHRKGIAGALLDAEHAGQHRGPALEQAHALPVQRIAGVLVDGGDLREGPPEDALEVVHAPVALPELLLEGHPGHEGRALRVHAVEPLREPGVDVEGHGVVRQPRDGLLVERHGVLHEALEVGRRELDDGWPENLLVGVARSPKLEAVDDGALERDGAPALAGGSQAKIRGRKTGELLLDRADVAALGIKLQRAAHEGREAVLDLDEAGFLLQRLGIQVVEDKARLRPPGKAHVHEIVGLGVERSAGLDLHADDTVPAGADPLVAGVAVGHAGLTEDGMLIEDVAHVLRGVHRREKTLLDRR